MPLGATTEKPRIMRGFSLLRGVSGLPPLAQRIPLAVRVAHTVWLGGQELVNLNAVELEVQGAGGHIHAPHLGALESDLLDRVIPVLGEILVPVMQGERVMLAQVLLVHHVETGVMNA